MARFIVQAAFWAVLVFGLPACLPAQILTLAQALDSAVQHHPAARSADLLARQQRQMLPGVASLSDPVATVESPTGNFYTVGVTQAFEMPGAYHRRSNLQKSRIALAESGIAATRQDIRYATALAYNELQYRNTLVQGLREQDSTLQALAAAAARQFEQGQIDAVASRFAALQAATMHTRLRQAEQDVLIAENQLQQLTGLSGPIVPEPWNKPGTSPAAEPASWQNNPALQMLRQETLVAERQIAVEKSLGLPQMTLGYLNQGERNSPVGNRFSAGLSVPLWRRQYNANVNAAQTGAEIARQNLAAQSLQTGAAWQQAFGEVQKSRLALDEYEQTVLPSARALADASRRLFEGGLSDLPAYLRNRKEALDAELEYLELMQTYHEAELQLRYLSGQL